ncbi:MAG: cbb3-type cytochrome c oxidase subunit 3 [Rhodobacteraceae bacterium]|nr:cbb3-type cytochrome c oxidase subunit 3 [Paracoccaceae bacterium]
MDTYSILREIADSWVLLALFSFFIGVIVWAFRPGSWRVHRETADIPFKYDDLPADAVGDETSLKEAKT